METMSPKQENSGQSRSASLTGEAKICSLPENKKKMKTLRRQSAPSLVISKALTKSRTLSRENCLSPVSPESCPLVQSFLTPSRTFVTHGHAQLKTGLQTQERCLFLFDDILLIAKAKSSTHFKLKAQVRVCEVWTASCVEEVCEGSMHPERSFVMGWPTCNCVATFSSVEQKERWLSFIKSRIKEEREKEEPKTIALRIFAKDAKTLTVSQSDCTTEVIAIALRQFGVVGCVKDYQLWVSSRKDDPPYPLIGHEFPFSIKMSHIRGKASQTGRAKEPLSPRDLLEQPPLDSQCQFILKPSRVALEQAILEPAQKPLRRKRSLINWAFWRGSSPQLDCPPPSPTSPASGRLFGLPLTAVCQGDALPKPVMDMLAFLFREGPFTRGIFRRSASAKACREMKERLNTGTETLPLTCETIFVTAAVFKDFLRHIPGSLLSQDLYEQWVGLAGDCEEDKVQAVQRLVQSLPRENQSLLRHMLAVLHCIQRHAQDNQMNSFNLSVCIAPSMLWAPAPCSPDVESEGTKKVSEVVRFMIEHCCEVLGDDVTSLFGGFPHKGSSHISDVSTVQLNDSSYDSLENELNEDTESPFQDLRGCKDKQENRSRDSVITLSDCDLDQPDPDHDPDPVPHTPVRRQAVNPRKFTQSGHQPDPPSEQDARACQGGRWLRRCSEPAIRHPASSLVPNLGQHNMAVRKTSYDGVMCGGQGEGDVFVQCLGDSLTRAGQTGPGDGGREVEPDKRTLRDVLRRKHKLPSPLRLDVSCSSLSSPATSPSGSSMSSLDSAFSQCSMDCTAPAPVEPSGARGTSSPKTPAPTSPRSPVTTSPLSHGNAITPSSAPREPCEWGQHKIAHGLHPNTWLKRDRRLSLRQQDMTGWDEEEPWELGNGQNNKSLPSNGLSLSNDRKAHGLGEPSRKRANSPPSYQQAMLQMQDPRSPVCKATDKVLTVKELRQLHDQASARSAGSDVTQKNASSVRGGLPQSVFFGQASSSLTLQRQNSHSLIPAKEGSNRTSSMGRRASEPSVGRCVLRRISTPDLESLHKQVLGQDGKASLGRSPQDSGPLEPLRSSQGLGPEPRFCQAVRDYFSHTHTDPDSCCRSTQEVASAIVQTKREWQSRRCSDPRFDDFDQMLFAEESYV
ncbi:rho GTPase-activating protein 20-like [Conger conger]|uniref:rho GTPase-activating protein 20-like n=1 Tax=Conger conger TaxID=82655 RepID=UPI002A5A4842|nr:rho GTPase-activating protein 20-like [Conger conger]